MRNTSLLLSFILTILVASKNGDFKFSSTKTMGKIDSLSYLDHKLVDIFDFYAQKIIKSNMSHVDKQILLKTLTIKLIRAKKRVINRIEKTTKKPGFMHWRTG